MSVQSKADPENHVQDATSAIHAENLSKAYQIYDKPIQRLWDLVLPGGPRYREFWAVKNVYLDIPHGSTVGIIGENGAGKSTLLKMLSTYLPPTEGTVRIAGHDTRTAPLAARMHLGYLPEHNALYDAMRVDRFLTFMGKARGVTGARLAQRLAWVEARCTLGPVLGKRISECSKGFRQRIGLAAALIHDPPVLLLDEPTHGLDPLQVIAFRDFIHELRPGRAILFSSHILAEVLGISDRLLVLSSGELVLDGGVPDLERSAKEESRTIEEVVLEAVSIVKSRESATSTRGAS
jgi:ABC-2 type transport system ATP-binding protein